MSNLTFFKLGDLGPGRESLPVPERLGDAAVRNVAAPSQLG